jgi:hypothetical protein
LLPVGSNEGFSGSNKRAIPTSEIWECSNSVLQLAQIRTHFGICHLERVTANKLEAPRRLFSTYQIRKLEINRVEFVAANVR